jgi:chromatin segregation and condensation protein Rec8/ScpA/Scc1 (kleisin family)
LFVLPGCEDAKNLRNGRSLLEIAKILVMNSKMLLPEAGEKKPQENI